MKKTKALAIFFILFFSIGMANAQQNIKFRTESFTTVKKGKANQFSEWVIISIKNGKTMYVLFEDNAYNLALDISLAGEQTDEEDNTYLLVLGTEMDGTEWTIYIYDTTMYLFLNNSSYYIFENLKEY